MSSELAPPIRGTVLAKLSRSGSFLFLDVRALCTLSPEETIRLYREKPSEEHKVSYQRSTLEGQRWAKGLLAQRGTE